MAKAFICISLILILSFRLGCANRPLNPQAFDPQKCIQSVTKGSICLTDLWTHYGKPSTACCKAIEELDDTCVPSLFPLNPLIGPFLKGICSGSSGAFPFPFPFPFPCIIGGDSGGLPFPFPFPPVGGGGSGGLPFPFPFPPIGGGGGSGGLPYPFAFPPVSGGGGKAPPPQA